MKSEEAAGIQIIRLALFGSLLAGLARTWADPDLWGHVRFGGDIVASGFAKTDPYSFTSDMPWINHEWLSEVLMHASWTLGGNAGLIALKMTAIAATLGLVVLTVRRERVSDFERDFLLFASIVGMWSRVFVVRPQIFSIALFAALLAILKGVERGHTRAIWLLPFLFAIWTNLHGGWIVGLGTLAVWTIGALTPSGFARSGPNAQAAAIAGASRAIFATAASLSALATLANPYGIQMWAFLRATVGPARPNINDWRPLLETGAGVVAPWIISAALAIAAFVRGGRRIPLRHAVIVIALGIATVRVNRLDVFFMLSVVMLLAGHLAPAADARRAQPLWTKRTKGALAAAAIAALLACWHVRAQFNCLRLDGAWMPERESGAFIADNRFEGRLLTWFDWGQYAIWHFAPRLRVSIDGRRETVYSDAYVSQHVKLYFDPETSLALLDRLSPDYAWLPADLPLVPVLQRRGWTRVFTGPISIVLARGAAESTHAGVPSPRACFPGP